MKIIGWPYKVPLKSLTGHTSLWVTDFPMTLQKSKKLMSLPRVVFLYGSFWCIVWFACQVNPGMLFHGRNSHLLYSLKNPFLVWMNLSSSNVSHKTADYFLVNVSFDMNSLWDILWPYEIYFKTFKHWYIHWRRASVYYMKFVLRSDMQLIAKRVHYLALDDNSVDTWHFSSVHLYK